ncbi:MAG: anti-sigma factor [Bacteroidetes bacterium MedPE-SWsnd-G2]|nr:MAG: anti-sigma factor [Bacteroidetes bacterium MedPE-SWsnd-G2]
MKREDLILKWLDHNLTAEEEKEFRALNDYDELIKLSESSAQFKAPDFDSETVFKNVIHNTSKTSSINWNSPFLKIAALLIVALGIYFGTSTSEMHIQTLAAEKTNLNLPDLSEVMLNADSELTYNPENWAKNRSLSLNGEAYFKVAKGSKFNVNTKTGIVSVLGTQFNVKDRENYFEVRCFEGRVNVNYNTTNTILTAGDSFLIIDGKLIAKEKEALTQPHWIINKSQFSSIPYKQVLAEFERQYNVTFDASGIDTNQLFTGTFVHNNYDVAIKSITFPLHLRYGKNHGQIKLSLE